MIVYRFFFFLYFLSIILLASEALAQRESDCTRVIRYSADTSLGKTYNKIIIKNNTSKPISCMFNFPENGFYDEETMREFLLKGTNDTLSYDSNRIIVLNNIARIIKSSKHRNFNLLFSVEEEAALSKKYSPLAMISSFYDKQCHDYQRLASQLAILTHYFNKDDFVSYSIKNHNVLDIRFGERWVFHDFDPAQPGFRFLKNKNTNTYASFADIIKNKKTIQAKEFYSYDGRMLCPWIKESYYRSLFQYIKTHKVYTDLDNIYSFMPKWIIPSDAILQTSFPDTSFAGYFGGSVTLDTTENEVARIFKTYKKTLKYNNKHLKEKVNNLVFNYFNKKFDFVFDINYFYLIKEKLIVPGSSTSISNIATNYFMQLIINTGADTLFFPSQCMIPLPLHKILINKGMLSFSEIKTIDSLQKEIRFDITDSLVIHLYNEAVPVLTKQSERLAPKIGITELIFGPANGFITPYSEAILEYYFNPFYYAFHNLSFLLHYCGTTEEHLDVIYEE